MDDSARDRVSVAGKLIYLVRPSTNTGQIAFTLTAIACITWCFASQDKNVKM